MSITRLAKVEPPPKRPATTVHAETARVRYRAGVERLIAIGDGYPRGHTTIGAISHVAPRIIAGCRTLGRQAQPVLNQRLRGAVLLPVAPSRAFAIERTPKGQRNSVSMAVKP